MKRKFWLVQRIRFEPKVENPSPVQALGASFGGGRLNNDFVFDYMGSSEFEFGAISKAGRLFRDGGDLVSVRYAYDGHDLDFVFRVKDGEPFEDWVAWVEGGMRTKEMSHDLRHRLARTKPPWMERDPGRGWETALWWSLDDAVMWGFAAEGYIERFIGAGSSEEDDHVRA